MMAPIHLFARAGQAFGLVKTIMPAESTSFGGLCFNSFQPHQFALFLRSLPFLRPFCTVEL